MCVTSGTHVTSGTRVTSGTYEKFMVGTKRHFDYLSFLNKNNVKFNNPELTSYILTKPALALLLINAM